MARGDSPSAPTPKLSMSISYMGSSPTPSGSKGDAVEATAQGRRNSDNPYSSRASPGTPARISSSRPATRTPRES